jgi:hypothetical protein
MRRSKRLSLVFFILGFCSCIFLTGIVRYLTTIDWKLFSTDSDNEVLFHSKGDCEDCNKISTKYWEIGRLKDNNDLHLESAIRMGIEPFQSNADFEERISTFVIRGKLDKLEDCDTYKLKNPTHSYPYLVPEAADLLDEIGERFQKKLDEIDIKPYYMLVSSVLRTNESQYGLGKRNGNATKKISAHLYGTTFDISYKEFLPPHGQSAPEGYCRHDMLRHPLAAVLTEMSAEGRCKVVREVKQACYHITVSK